MKWSRPDADEITEPGKQVQHHVDEVDEQVVQQRHVAGDETLGQREH